MRLIVNNRLAVHQLMLAMHADEQGWTADIVHGFPRASMDHMERQPPQILNSLHTTACALFRAGQP